jgi:hypothetical protein
LNDEETEKQYRILKINPSLPAESIKIPNPKNILSRYFIFSPAFEECTLNNFLYLPSLWGISSVG